jgi:hypothetical protein
MHAMAPMASGLGTANTCREGRAIGKPGKGHGPRAGPGTHRCYTSRPLVGLAARHPGIGPLCAATWPASSPAFLHFPWSIFS